jgi:hypothetical protein
MRQPPKQYTQTDLFEHVLPTLRDDNSLVSKAVKISKGLPRIKKRFAGAARDRINLDLTIEN